MSPLPIRRPETLAEQRLCAQAELPSPLGSMLALATEQGLAALLFDSDKYHQVRPTDVPNQPTHPHIRATQAWLEGYWRGEAPDPDSVPLDLAGTAFQRAVWKILLRIPQGETQTYGAVARQVSPDTAPRATGGAIGRNPVAVLVPCHRVIGANGSLTGYASGLPRKLRLLQHENVLLL